MRKKWPFVWLFTISFTGITAFVAAVFIFFGLLVIDRFFSYYVDEVHEETQHMLVMQAANYYKMFGTWNNYNGAELGAIAKLSGDYFTITDTQGKTVYTSEKDVARCCANPNHVYTHVKYPVLVEGKKVGELIAGYFSNHITSPEADAFRGSGVLLVILAILCITLSGALVSLLFFYRLSKPIKHIASTAKEMANGHLHSRVAVQSTVKEMHEIADAINSLGTSLLEQEKFRQQLVVELSHELRTPLHILLNQIEAILDGIHQPDNARLESMHAEVARTSELLNELEARLIYENDTFVLNIMPADISEITKKVALGYEGSFAKKGLEFLVQIEPNIIASVDAVRFAQVLINILSNGLKYTDKGGVSLSLSLKNNQPELTITDSGTGIAPEIIENISTRCEGAFRGINSKGVGLYITKLIVDKHGWKLCINSSVGSGTIIRVLM